MSDQQNNFDCNYLGQQNPYHQPQQNMMFHPNNLPQGINQNAHSFMNPNNMMPQTFSPNTHGFNPQIHQVGHNRQHQNQHQGLMGQQAQILYMQQQQQNHQQHQQQQVQTNVNGMKNLTSRNSIENIQIGRNYQNQSQQHDNQQQNYNKNTNGSRLNMGIASFPHIPQPQHQQPGNQNMQNKSNMGINSSPPPHHNQSQKQHQQKGHQAVGQHESQHGQDSQYSNEENQDELSHLSSTNIAPGVNGKGLLEHLELSFFKVEQCTNTNSHNHKQCKYYHTNKDRRRVGINYTSDPCNNPQNCPDGENCLKAHNKVEELYCPDKYKTKFCTCYPNNCHNCEYGNYCSFAHTESDIKIDLIENYQFDEDFYVFYYKTVWCPFNFIKHDKAQCVYSHNWQDYRRRPQEYNYEPHSCPNWKPGSYITKYEEGCSNKFDCNKCHGWKESEYHPRNYRTKQCTQTTNNEKCNKGPQCPYYHNATEKRNLPQNIQDGLFKYRPRNRNIRNTYKKQNGQTPNDSQPFSSARINQLNSTQSLPDPYSNLQTFGQKQQQPQCQSPSIVQQDPQPNQNIQNGKQNVAIINKKPIKLNTTSLLEFPNNKNPVSVNEESSFFENIDNNFNDEQSESLEGMMTEGNKWNPVNPTASNNLLENQQQVFQIFSQNNQVRINNTRSFENFNIVHEFTNNNNNQYFQNQPNNYNGVPPNVGGQVNPEINELQGHFNQFSLINYDTGESDHIFNNGPGQNNNNNSTTGSNSQNNNSYSQF